MLTHGISNTGCTWWRGAKTANKLLVAAGTKALKFGRRRLGSACRDKNEGRKMCKEVEKKFFSLIENKKDSFSFLFYRVRVSPLSDD